MSDREQVRLVIVDAGRAGDPPFDIRLRQLLKWMLRSLSLRCVHITDVRDQADDQAGAAAEGNRP